MSQLMFNVSALVSSSLFSKNFYIIMSLNSVTLFYCYETEEYVILWCVTNFSCVWLWLAKLIWHGKLYCDEKEGKYVVTGYFSINHNLNISASLPLHTFIPIYWFWLSSKSLSACVFDYKKVIKIIFLLLIKTVNSYVL